MGIALDKSSETPLYLQLSDGMIQNIQQGKMLANTMIPSERTLMKQYDVSRATVRQALDRLTKLGYLWKEHGRGNFIKLPGLSLELGTYNDFISEMQAVGRTGRTEVLFFRIVQCYPSLVNLLGLTPKDYVFKFVRLHLADEEPLLLETTFLPYAGFEGFNKEDLSNAPLQEIITVWFRKAITRTEESFSIVSLDREQGRLLGRDEGSPAIEKKRLAICNQQVVEYTVSVTPDSRIVFRAVTQR